MEMLAPEIEAGLPARIIREGGLKAYYIRDFELIPSVDGEFESVAQFWNWLFCSMSLDGLTAHVSETGFRVADTDACPPRTVPAPTLEPPDSIRESCAAR